MLEQAMWTPWPTKEPDEEQWERELQFAARVQSTLLEARETVVSDAVACGFSVPHYLVGGDYFDFIRMPDGRLRVTVADVMGKGFGAAMLMTMLRAAVRAASPHVATPGQLLRQLNDLLYDDLQQVGSFITMACADFCAASQTVTMASAGAPYPMLLRADSGATEQIKVRGVTLGMLPNRLYHEERLQVNPDDQLILYTDGIGEARDAEGKELTTVGLEHLILSHRHNALPLMLKAVLAGVGKHAHGPGVRDDVTLVAVRFGSQ